MSYPPYRVQLNFVHLVYVIGPPLCLNKKAVIARGGSITGKIMGYATSLTIQCYNIKHMLISHTFPSWLKARAAMPLSCPSCRIETVSSDIEQPDQWQLSSCQDEGQG